MRIAEKTKEKGVAERQALRLRIAELEKAEAERKRVEGNLAKAEQEKAAILDSMSELVIIQDTEHRMIWVNKAAGKSVDLSPKQLVGRHCYEIWPKRDKPCVGCPVAKARGTGKSQETEITTPDGRVWFIRGYPIRDANGDITALVEVTLDITERKQAEETLKAEKNKLQSVIGAMEDGFTIQDKDYNIIYQNELSKELFGDRSGEKCYRAYEGREEVCDACPVAMAFRDGKSHTSERKVKLPSGEVRFWENTANPIRDAEGKIVSCLEVARNITVRKQAEEELQAEKNKLQSVIDSMEDHLTIRDRDYNIIYLAERVKKLWGDRIGEKCYRVFEGEDKICDGCPAEKAFRDGKSHTSERRVITPSGEVTFWENTVNPIRDAKGEIVSCLEIARNITERKRAEEALQAEKNKLQSVINAMEDGLTIQDKDYNIIYQNELLKELFGDRLGEKCYRVYALKDKVCNGCPVEKAFRDGKSHTSEREVTLPSGKVALWEPTANPIRDAQGKIVSCLEIIRDITERKRAEQALADELTRRRILIDQSLDGIVILDVEAKVYEANQCFAEMLGYTLEEVYKLHTWDWDKNFPPEKLLEMGRNVDEAGLHLETQHHRKDGSVIDVDISINGAMFGGQKLIFCVCHDITARKQAEQALLESEERFRSIVENSQAGVMILDDAYHFTYVNAELCKISGYSPEEIIGQDFRQFLDEESKQLVANRYLRRQKGEEVSPRYEFNFIHKDGQKRRVEISSSVIKDSAGRIRTIAQILDITDRKRAEEELQAEKNKLQSLIGAMEYTFTIQDKDYNIIYQNELSRISSGGDHVGDKCYQAYEHRDKLCDGCPVAMAFKDGQSHTAERTRLSPEGEVTFWENTANPIRDAKGDIISCLELARDITERKRVEQTLVDEATRRRILIEQSRDGIVVLNQNGKVYEANQKFAEMLGYTPQEAAELHVWDWEYLYPRERVLEMVRTVDEAGDHFETRHRRKDGSIYDVEISTNGAMFGGQKLIFCVCRDITARKQAEEKLKESEEKYKTLAEDAPMGIYINDFTGKFLYGNRKAAEIVGYKRRELLGKNFLKLKLLDSKGLAKAVKLLALNRMDRATGPDEFVLHRRDGDKRIVEIRTRITKVGGKKVVMGMIVDVTESKQAEEALHKSQEALEKMFESVTDGISVVGLDGIITEANRAAAEMHGFKSKAELVGRNALELIVPRDHERVIANMRKAIKQGTVEDVEYTLLRSDGSEFPGELSTSALRGADGNCVGHVTISRDITARKRGEQARKEAEDKYKNLVEGIGDVIWETDEKGMFTFISPKVKDILGYDVDEVVGKRRTLDLVPKGEAQKWLPRYKKVNAARKPFSGFEISQIHKNGNPVVFETSGAPFFDGAGNFKGFVGINKDITERKRAEEEVKRQKAYFQQLFDNSPEGIALLDEADRFVQVNKGFETLFGYGTEEIKGRFINEVLIPQERGEEAFALSRAALSNQVIRKETVRKRKDGSLVEVDVIGYPIQFDSQTVGVYVIYNDITERKQAERALRESQGFSSSLLESSPNPKFVTNPDTSVKYANPAFEKLTGFTLAEIAGRQVPYPWWPEEQKRERLTSFKNAMLTGGRRSERAMRKKNGERFWVAINSAPVVHEGKLLYFLVNWLDITERKQMEEERMELEQKAHLASRLASIGEMAAGIAHEINNPMTAVIGFSQLLMESDLPAEAKEDLGVIHKEAQRAANVARNLLTFARKQAPTKQPTNMNSIIEGVLKLRAYEQSVSNIRVRTHLAPDLPEVMADYSQMQQVFINIVLNAEGAMLNAGKGGTLTVTTQIINGSIRASFADSGPGISRENLNRIFDPFFTTKEVGKGTGLGLSVCHGIVAEHGGRIYAKSKTGGGATFVVELPVTNAHSSGERS